MSDLAGFAAQTRDALDLFLRTPGKRYLADGHVERVPVIHARFAVESVTLDSAGAPTAIVVRFRWTGEDAVYAVAFDAVPSEDGLWPVTPRQCAAYMQTNLQEYLVPYGINAAEQIERDGVVWLSWPYAGFGGRRLAIAPEVD
jgi:hypothetical protein